MGLNTGGLAVSEVDEGGGPPGPPGTGVIAQTEFGTNGSGVPIAAGATQTVATATVAIAAGQNIIVMATLDVQAGADPQLPFTLGLKQTGVGGQFDSTNQTISAGEEATISLTTKYTPVGTGAVSVELQGTTANTPGGDVLVPISGGKIVLMVTTD